MFTIYRESVMKKALESGMVSIVHYKHVLQISTSELLV
jgi:hypothetical protein